MSSWRQVVKRHGWWLLLTAVVTVVVTVATGFWLLPVYAVVNAVGTMFYVDSFPVGVARVRRVIMPLLAIALLPVGLLLITRSSAGLSPSDKVTAGDPSDDHRRRTAGVQMGATFGPGGRAK
ncbi:MAG: hypothetical protein HKN41_11950 [Ilumatobacter sp.]|nr:hypothetical protein [Ilumatobacter sp.]